MPARPWQLDFLDPADRSSALSLHALGSLSHAGTKPRGAKAAAASDSISRPSSTAAHLVLKKAWDTAFSPAKSLPMNAFMLWMSGSGVQIFSILITGMLLMQPIKGIIGVGAVFRGYAETARGNGAEGVSLVLPKLVYVAMHGLVMCLGLYKLQSMGLLPTSTSDWLAFLPPKQILEASAWRI